MLLGPRTCGTLAPASAGGTTAAEPLGAATAELPLSAAAVLGPGNSAAVLAVLAGLADAEAADLPVAPDTAALEPLGSAAPGAAAPEPDRDTRMAPAPTPAASTTATAATAATSDQRLKGGMIRVAAEVTKDALVNVATE